MSPRIGAHVSAAGGAAKLLARVAELKVEAVQIHPSAPQTYRQCTILPDDRALIKTTLAAQSIPLYFHSIYLINLASDDDRLWHASLGAVAHYLDIAPEFGAIGTVTHVGSHRGKGLAAVKPRLVMAAKKLTAASTGPRGQFIIENTAGGGGTLGRDLEELEFLFTTFAAQLDTGVCLDTCHLFAAGAPLADAAGWQAWLKDFDRRIGLKHLALIHLNDSKMLANSQRDRHANIGEGEIGLAALKRVVQDPKLKHVDIVLEVPGEGKGPDGANMERAKGLRQVSPLRS